MARLNEAYRTDALVAEDGVLYDTLGSVGPTALTKSGIAAGFKQAAINVGAEVIYDCPAQWLAEAFSGGGGDDHHYYAEGGARTVDDEGGNKVGNRSRTNDNDNDDDASSTAAGAGARDGAPVGRSGSVVVAEAARRALDEDEERDAVFYRLETLGYRVGQGLVER